MSQLPTSSQYNMRTWLTFLVPSLIGLFLFMTPIPIADGMTIPIALMAKAIKEGISSVMIELLTFIICVTVCFRY